MHVKIVYKRHNRSIICEIEITTTKTILTASVGVTRALVWVTSIRVARNFKLVRSKLRQAKIE